MSKQLSDREQWLEITSGMIECLESALAIIRRGINNATEDKQGKELLKRLAVDEVVVMKLLKERLGEEQKGKEQSSKDKHWTKTPYY